MGKTFDDFYDGASELSAVHIARITLNWESQKEMPPPFNLLAVPSHVLGFSIRMLGFSMEAENAPEPPGKFTKYYTWEER